MTETEMRQTKHAALSFHGEGRAGLASILRAAADVIEQNESLFIRDVAVSLSDAFDEWWLTLYLLTCETVTPAALDDTATDRTGQPMTTWGEPAPHVNDRPCVQDAVIADIESRKQHGIAKYGTPLQLFNGRNAVQDAYEEVLDLACYLKQLRMEQDALLRPPGADEAPPGYVRIGVAPFTWQGHEAMLIERLAAQAHEAWSGWMKYMLPKLGMVVDAPPGHSGWIPSQAAYEACDSVEPTGMLHLWRWLRQMEMPYDELTEAEKESDRVEARRYLDALRDVSDG